MRIIFHIDVNAAFLSWTAAYRCQVLGEQQDLRDIPAAIAGEKANRHGIILAKSLPAKRMGVKTGEPIFQAVKNAPSWSRCRRTTPSIPRHPGGLSRCSGPSRRWWSSIPLMKPGRT